MHDLVAIGGHFTQAVRAWTEPEYTLPGKPPACLFVLLALGLATAAVATDPERVTVERDGKTYQVQMSVVLEAPAERVRALLTDYAHLDRVNPAVLESELLAAPAAGVTRVRTTLKSCVWFFCKEIDLVEDLETSPEGDIRAQIVTELSDLKAGQTHWQIRPDGAATRLTYTSTIEPGFWVPPLIGPRAIVKNLRRNLALTAENLERLSNDN